MRVRSEDKSAKKQTKISSWAMGFIVAFGVAVLSGLGVQEWKTNQVVGHSQYRFNLALVGKSSGISFVSIDPTEKAVLSLKFPRDLAIKSRTSGEYSISSLYKLGSYKEMGGKFARQKIQGFMRVPVPGYMVVENVGEKEQKSLRMGLLKAIFGQSETSLSRFDAALLLYRTGRYGWRRVEEAELVRAGAIADNTYHPERLQEYIGPRLFDWGIGGSQITVAIVNASGENGLGSDMADFLANLGMDVVMVRSLTSGSLLDKSEWQVDSEVDAQELSYVFQNLFSFDEPKVEKISGEYRAKVVIRVGKDASELF